ncbi:dienelactone hydrolase family protein [Psychrobacillus sp. MER TA 171]|uniref:alpha/beta hydrolase n=1 Tax=Psychrobacillus sp. MER TA 171 TaxID=2939577 RepID=UPI00203D766C|nr:dienelactone hydrolase family protein [Psychrobacillus sp. MER TA 171]MCM3359326.1 dienelactone hydrolase family protein [Psychrobacillus sp. MER TA 171]
MKSPFTYKYIAPTTNGNDQPSLFLFHGMGSNEEDLLQLVKELEGSHHIFSLRGPIVFNPGYAFFTIEEEGRPERQVFDKVVTYLHQFIAEAVQEYSLDQSKISLVGFSQGAVLAQTIALTMGDVIKGVAALSGYLPDFVKEEYRKHPVDHLTMFISHGEYDYVIPSHWGLESKNYFEELGANVTYKTYEDGHGVVPENQLDLVNFLKQL